jgi:N-hydroxyarylamine O-acetyltransferase
VTVFDTDRLDLAAYLRRIGCEARPQPDLALLRAIALRHPLTIPFENLNVLLGQPLPLDTPSLQTKLIAERRGGWCFEHNVLLGTALRAIGFDVLGLAARVMWLAPQGAVTPRSHMVLLVTLEGTRYIVDAGFGGLTLTGPLRLETGVEQETPHETFRLRQADGLFVLDASLRGEWRPLYRFDLTPQALVDYEISSWYLSTNPRSHFRSTLVAALAAADRRYALRNAEFSIHHRDGYSERRVIASGAQMRAVLEESFGIAVPSGEDVAEVLDRVVTTAAIAT